MKWPIGKWAIECYLWFHCSCTISVAVVHPCTRNAYKSKRFVPPGTVACGVPLVTDVSHSSICLLILTQLETTQYLRKRKGNHNLDSGHTASQAVRDATSHDNSLYVKLTGAGVLQKTTRRIPFLFPYFQLFQIL